LVGGATRFANLRWKFSKS